MSSLPQRRAFANTCDIFIGLGGNRPGETGDVLTTLQRALGFFPAEGIEVAACSSWYWSDPMGGIPQERYVNGVVSVATTLPPIELLAALHRLERAFGRRREEEPRWGPRTLDLDLLSYGDVISTEGVLLPHPGISERAFVLVPLREVAPDWRHPVSGKSVSELLAALPVVQREALERIEA